MKYSLLFLSIFLISCGSSGNEYQSDYYQDEETSRECVEPENPYDEGSGHYAGYEWAESKGQSCGGNSDSFIEGCEEYYSQLSDYETCSE